MCSIAFKHVNTETRINKTKKEIRKSRARQTSV